MAKELKTSVKRPINPFKGAIDGVPFSETNQPTPEAKKKGWEEWRKERILTQSIIKRMIGDDGLFTDKHTKFIDSLLRLANDGNAKAIDVVCKCLEEEVIKVNHSGSIHNVNSNSAELTPERIKEIESNLENKY